MSGGTIVHYFAFANEGPSKTAKAQTSMRFYSPICLYVPGHAKMCPISYANNKGADQPAHPCNLCKVSRF